MHIFLKKAKREPVFVLLAVILVLASAFSCLGFGASESAMRQVRSIEGRATSELDRDEYRLGHVSVIYQNFNLFGHLTVLENAAYPLYVRGLPAKEAEAAASEKLLAVGLTPEQFRRYPNMLSGGEQQRVAIARALASGSELILADEPTGNLDSENSRNIMDILVKLAHEEGRCVIVVTHDPAVAEQADRAYKLRDGRLDGE